MAAGAASPPTEQRLATRLGAPRPHRAGFNGHSRDDDYREVLRDLIVK